MYTFMKPSKRSSALVSVKRSVVRLEAIAIEVLSTLLAAIWEAIVRFQMSS